MHGDGLIAPGIFELMASIGDVNELHAQFVRRIFEAARLVTQFRCKKEQSFGRICHSWCDSTRRSDKAFGACDSIFHQRLLGTDGDQLVLSRFSAAVPGFAEERNADLGLS